MVVVKGQKVNKFCKEMSDISFYITHIAPCCYCSSDQFTVTQEFSALEKKLFFCHNKKRNILLVTMELVKTLSPTLFLQSNLDMY